MGEGLAAETGIPHGRERDKEVFGRVEFFGVHGRNPKGVLPGEVGSVLRDVAPKGNGTVELRKFRVPFGLGDGGIEVEGGLVEIPSVGIENGESQAEGVHGIVFGDRRIGEGFEEGDGRR